MHTTANARKQDSARSFSGVSDVGFLIDLVKKRDEELIALQETIKTQRDALDSHALLESQLMVEKARLMEQIANLHALQSGS